MARKRKGLKAQMALWNHMTREIQAAAERSKWFTLYGRKYRITAEFCNNDAGTDAANDWMMKNPGNGVLAVQGGRIIIAAMSDNGECLQVRR